jgi:hypothetical protein
LGKILEVRESKGEILHYISTGEGHSGSPVIRIKGSQLTVVAIHKGAVVTTIKGTKMRVNIGPALTPALIESLAEGATSIGAEMFRIAPSIAISQSLRSLGDLSPNSAKSPNKKPSTLMDRLRKH